MAFPLRGVGEVQAADVAIGAVLFGATLTICLSVVAFVLVRLPRDYFAVDGVPAFWPERPPWQQIAGRVGKNVLGAVLVAVGVVLSIPGVPGQGLLTMLIGVILLDIPGKRRLERRIVASPPVLRVINGLRARFGKPPLWMGEPPAPAAPPAPPA